VFLTLSKKKKRFLQRGRQNLISFPNNNYSFIKDNKSKKHNMDAAKDITAGVGRCPSTTNDITLQTTRLSIIYKMRELIIGSISCKVFNFHHIIASNVDFKFFQNQSTLR
jgi:hypothetical protein